MATNLLIGAKQRGRSFAQDEGDIPIVEWSNLLDEKDGKQLQLPDLCKRIRGTEKGKKMCPVVAQLMKKVVDAQKKPYPFVCCCWAGAKILVIPTPETAYFALCRSPGRQPHDRRLRRIEQLSSVPFHELKRDWLKLKPFGVDFAQKATAKLEDEMGVEIHKEVETELRILGEAYGRFEFDRIMSDTAEEVSESNGKYPGMLKVDFASKPEGVIAVRVVTEELSVKQQPWYTPIIGLVVEKKHQGDLGKALKSARLEAVSKALLPDNLILYKNFEKSGNGVWKARVSAYLEEDKNPGEEWWKDFVRRTYAGLDVGGGTVCARLLRELDNEDFERFKEDLFFPRASRVTSSMRQGEQEHLYYRVFKDLADNIVHITPERIRDLTVVKQVIAEVLSMIKPYQLLDTLPESELSVSRRDILLRDFLVGSSEYVTLTKRDLVPLEITGRNYAQDVVANFLELYPEFTVKTLLEATRNRDISLGESPGRESWLSTILFFKARKSEEDLVRLEEVLFELDASELKQTLLSLRADLAGILVKSISLGTLYSYPVIEHIRRKAYRKHVSERIHRRKAKGSLDAGG